MELEIIAEENERNSEGGEEEDEEMIEEGEDELVILDPSHVRHSQMLKEQKKAFLFGAPCHLAPYGASASCTRSPT